ncbi:hypothetical protein N7528_000084 [Penicillium herquei]|nr:hypothetical protein N7528_000084 [Penicillium herquei]
MVSEISFLPDLAGRSSQEISSTWATEIINRLLEPEKNPLSIPNQKPTIILEIGEFQDASIRRRKHVPGKFLTSQNPKTEVVITRLLVSIKLELTNGLFSMDRVIFTSCVIDTMPIAQVVRKYFILQSLITNVQVNQSLGLLSIK